MDSSMEPEQAMAERKGSNHDFHIVDDQAVKVEPPPEVESPEVHESPPADSCQSLCSPPAAAHAEGQQQNTEQATTPAAPPAAAVPGGALDDAIAAMSQAAVHNAITIAQAQGDVEKAAAKAAEEAAQKVMEQKDLEIKKMQQQLEKKFEQQLEEAIAKKDAEIQAKNAENAEIKKKAAEAAAQHRDANAVDEDDLKSEPDWSREEESHGGHGDEVGGWCDKPGQCRYCRVPWDQKRPGVSMMDRHSFSGMAEKNLKNGNHVVWKGANDGRPDWEQTLLNSAENKFIAVALQSKKEDEQNDRLWNFTKSLASRNLFKNHDGRSNSLSIQHDQKILYEALKAIQFDPENWENPDKFLCFDWKGAGKNASFSVGCMHCMGIQTIGLPEPNQYCYGVPIAELSNGQKGDWEGWKVLAFLTRTQRGAGQQQARGQKAQVKRSVWGADSAHKAHHTPGPRRNLQWQPKGTSTWQPEWDQEWEAKGAEEHKGKQRDTAKGSYQRDHSGAKGTAKGSYHGKDQRYSGNGGNWSGHSGKGPGNAADAGCVYPKREMRRTDDGRYGSDWAPGRGSSGRRRGYDSGSESLGSGPPHYEEDRYAERPKRAFDYDDHHRDNLPCVLRPYREERPALMRRTGHHTPPSPSERYLIRPYESERFSRPYAQRELMSEMMSEMEERLARRLGR
jgi:chemotaxis protein histidine kinase CheA